MTTARNPLKKKLANRQTTCGLWVTLESPTITEIAVTLGLDWVVIDAEHGHLDFKELMEHIRATRNSDTAPLVRIQEVEQGLIKRVLDIGAAGIVVPQVFSADEVDQAIRFAKYPPWGVRGVGTERATRWGLGLKSDTLSANSRVSTPSCSGPPITQLQPEHWANGKVPAWLPNCWKSKTASAPGTCPAAF